MGDSANLSDAEFNTLLRRMLKKLSEDLSSIKKIQSETKDTLIETKNNLQGNSSSVNDTKIQINDMEYRGEKTTNQNKKKKELKKTRVV